MTTATATFVNTKRAFGDGNFWFDCVKRRRNAMRTQCLLLFEYLAPPPKRRRRQRSVLITLLLCFLCVFFGFAFFLSSPTTTSSWLSQMLWLNVLLSRSRTLTATLASVLINYNDCDGNGDDDAHSANLSTRFFFYPLTFYVRVVLGGPQSFSNMIVRCNGLLLTEIVARGRRDESATFAREGDASAHGRYVSPTHQLELP